VAADAPGGAQDGDLHARSSFGAVTSG